MKEEDPINQRINCRQCRFRFPIQIPSDEDWRIEAQCPACEAWDTFTIEDTRELPQPDLEELDRATQRLGEKLWQPINDHRDHPVVAWIDRVGNGVFEDDYSEPSWPIPWWVYRFTCRGDAAYIWMEEGLWFVRCWHPIRSNRNPPEPVEIFSFIDALDCLTR